MNNDEQIEHPEEKLINEFEDAVLDDAINMGFLSDHHAEKRLAAARKALMDYMDGLRMKLHDIDLENAALNEAVIDAQRQSCVAHRCKEHRHIPVQNRNEFSGAECGGCIAVERDKYKSYADALSEPPM